MNNGLRILKRHRAVSLDLARRFLEVPVANVGDCMARMTAGGARLRPMHSGGRMAGPALTVKSRPGDNLMLHKALQLAQPGDVIVVDAGGDLTNAITGEIMVGVCCWGEMPSVLAPNFQRFRRASSKVTFSSLASRQAISRAWACTCCCNRAISAAASGGSCAMSMRGAAVSPSMLGMLHESERVRISRCDVNASAGLIAPSAAADDAEITQALPRQTDRQGFELLRGQLQRGRRRDLPWRALQPDKAPGMQSPRGAPHAEAVVHQQLDARGPQVGEQVPVVRMRRADGVDDDVEQPVGAGAHVLRLGAQP